MRFTPGPGVGGHCIPVAPYYLSWRAREFDFIDRFIELAADINVAMPRHVVDLLAANSFEASFAPDADKARWRAQLEAAFAAAAG